MKLKNIPYLRISAYLFGLMVLSLGIAVSVHSDLGCSPVASIPYMLNLTTGLDMGIATTIWQCFLVVLQMVILGNEFKPSMFLQIITSLVFGSLNAVACSVMGLFSYPASFLAQLLLICIGFTLCGFGIWLYSSAALTTMPSEGIVKVISEKYGKRFYTVKVAFDITSVIISASGCILFLRVLGSVGLGTVIIAFMQGTMAGFFARSFGKRLNSALKYEEEAIMR